MLSALAASLFSCQDGTSKQSGILPQAPFEGGVETADNIELIEIGGNEYFGHETHIDLSGRALSYEKLKEYPQKLKGLKVLNTGDTVLSGDEYAALCSVNENVSIISKIAFESITIDLSKNEIDISENVISDKDGFDRMLSLIKDGKKFVMCDCGYTNEEMQALREKYTQHDFAWRIYMGKWSLRTDDEAFSVMIYDYNYTRMTSEDIEVLKYCTNMHALDLGHQAITDLSVIGQLSELRVLILADNKVSDISPLAKLTKLEYLELFVNRVTDVTPLSECVSLVDLNIGFNRTLTDISPIYTLENIQRLWLPTTNVSAQKHDEISAAFPYAKIVFSDPDSISSGWRTHPRYYTMRKMFTNNKYDPEFVS